MTQRDRRSFRVALVADRYLNPPPGGMDAVAVLIDADWGAIQLPADAYSDEVAGPLLEQVAEHAEEFHRRGYDLVVVGDRAGLDETLAAVGVPRPDRIQPKSADELRAFLDRRPRPPATESG